MKFRNIKIDFGFDYVFPVLCIVMLFFSTYHLISFEHVSGWDTPGHFYLLTKMVGYLQSGHITGYDIGTLGGFPAFTFYSPLPYIIISAFYFLTFKTVSLVFLFNLFIFLVPFYFLIAVYFSARTWFGKMAGNISLIFASFYLMGEKVFASFGIGLAGSVYGGLFTNLFGISSMVLLIGLIGYQLNRKSRKVLFVSTCLFASIILSHILTAIFTVFVLFLIFLCNFKELYKKILIIFIGGLILSSFWTVPFLLNIKFTSSFAITSPFPGGQSLVVIYPFLHFILKNPGINIIPGLLLFLFGFIGIFSLISSGKKLFPLLFFIGFLFLSSGYLLEFFYIPIHYYRFLSHLFVINIFLATFGCLTVFNKIVLVKNFYIHKVLFWLTYLFLIFSMLISGIAIFDLNKFSDKPISLQNFYSNNYFYHYYEYPYFNELKEIIEYIKTNHPSGRIFSLFFEENQYKIGSPQFLGAFLPLYYDVEVINGLLRESSLSDRFTNLETTSSFSTLLKRYRLYGVQYVVFNKTFYENLKDNIEKTDDVHILKTTGEFYILGLKSFKPFFESTTYHPFLFVENSDVKFKDFALNWYKDSNLYDKPVIYSNKSFEDIPQIERDNIGGLIVGVSEESPLTLDLYQKWQKTDKKIIFLNSKPIFQDYDKTQQMYFVPISKDKNADWTKDLNLILEKLKTSDIAQKEVVPDIKQNEYFKFNSNDGVLINYSYFPRWKSKNHDQTVYWATPSFMFVFGKGENELYYN